jgi:hypothetical protein
MMNETQALNEAVLLLARKARRLDGFDQLWAKLPDGAKEALLKAESAADRSRDYRGVPAAEDWPTDFVEDGEE